MSHQPKLDNAAVTARSKQNLSCNWTGSADFGRLVPIHWEELLQGDHVIKCHPRIEMQMLPFASPTFGKIDLYCHYFVVPIRQLWNKAYDVWSQTGVYKDAHFPWLSPKVLCAQYNYSGYNDANKRAFFKHWTSLGLNPFFSQAASAVTDNTTPISDLPFRAYNKIWWDFYRDPEVLRDESVSNYLYDGDLNNDPAQDYAIKFMYPHVRSIKNNWISNLFASQGDSPTLQNSVFNPRDILPYHNVVGSDAKPDASTLSSQIYDPDTDVTYPDAASVRMNRLIESLTRLSERLSLSGKRQIEALFARYGVKPTWSKMNLARYVGGAKSTVMVSDIISNADTATVEDLGSPLGAKAGSGYCALSDLNIEVSVDEPSILMGIVSVMPHIHYVQGLSKKWQRKELTDFFQDSLQYVGNVAVANREVAMKYRSNQSYVNAQDAATFAYCDPYYEYKMGLDILAGDFMTYHNVELPPDDREKRDILYMQSMEQYIDFPFDRQFNLNNLLVDGDQFNKIFSYLGGSVDDDVDDHFHLCVDKEVIIDRPMEGFAIPTLETTSDPHAKKQALGSDTIL